MRISSWKMALVEQRGVADNGFILRNEKEGVPSFFYEEDKNIAVRGISR